VDERAAAKRARPRRTRQYAEGHDGITNCTDRFIRVSVGGTSHRPQVLLRITGGRVAADCHPSHTAISTNSAGSGRCGYPATNSPARSAAPTEAKRQRRLHRSFVNKPPLRG